MAENKQLGVILLVAAAGLAFWQFGDRDSDDTHKIDDKITTVQLAAGHADITIDVTAAKWRWRFGYPGGVVQGGALPVLMVPAGRVVRFRLTSLDVVHAFWIPDRKFKRDANPRDIATFDMRFPAGGFAGVGECSEFCGLDHADMRFAVRAVAPAAFRAWLARRRAGA